VHQQALLLLLLLQVLLPVVPLQFCWLQQLLVQLAVLGSCVNLV
jgi:hypothetical protein